MSCRSEPSGVSASEHDGEAEALRRALEESLRTSASEPAPKTHAEDVRGNLGPIEPLDSLREEFRFNAAFGAKVRRLEEEGYCGWRRVRGDGNCFYRALGFGLAESLAAAPTVNRVPWATRLAAEVAAVRPEEAELAAHHELLSWLDVFSSACEGDVQEHLLMVSEPGSSLDLALIRALRLVTGRFIERHASDDEVGGGISFDVICMAQGYAGAGDFCRGVVYPMGIEAESLVLAALPKALDMSLRVVFLDRSEGHDFSCEYGGEHAPGREQPRVHLQLRPGHYDLLYVPDCHGRSAEG